MLAGEQVLPALGVTLPAETWATVREKRMVLLMGCWWMGNTIRNGLTSTGAFEVYYGGQRLHSKLESGRMPSLAEVMAGINEVRASPASGSGGAHPSGTATY